MEVWGGYLKPGQTLLQELIVLCCPCLRHMNARADTHMSAQKKDLDHYKGSTTWPPSRNLNLKLQTFTPSKRGG